MAFNAHLEQGTASSPSKPTSLVNARSHNHISPHPRADQPNLYGIESHAPFLFCAQPSLSLGHGYLACPHGAHLARLAQEREEQRDWESDG